MTHDLSKYLTPRIPSNDAGLEATDDRLSEVIDFFEKGDWARSAERADVLAENGFFDIRPMSYVLYGAFREGGIGALGAIFDVVAASVGTNFDATGPRSNQTVVFAKRLAWLFGAISDYLAYYKKAGGTEWTAMRVGVSIASIAELVERVKGVDAALAGDAFAKPAAAFGTLSSFLKDLSTEMAVAAQVRAEAITTSSNSETSESVEENKADPEDEKEAQPQPASGSNVKRSSKTTITLEVSPDFLVFLAKLKAFETLIENQEQLKAAIVAEDLQHILENFDPRTYFPGLLSRFSELLSENAEELSNHMESRDSFAWKTLAQFYKVNLDKFVQGRKGS